MPKYDISTFTWYDLGPKPPEMTINVSAAGVFTFSSELRNKMPESFRLCASQDKRVLCIAEAAGPAVTFPKSGAKKIPQLIQDIKDAGVSLPAKYFFRAEEGQLFGELRPSAPPRSGMSKRRQVPQKPRNISPSEEEHIL